MGQYIMGAGLLAVMSLGGALVYQNSKVDALRDDNERLTRNAAVLGEQIEQARAARAVADASRQRQETIARAANDKIEAIRNLKLGECADAPLDPALRAILDSVPAKD